MCGRFSLNHPPAVLQDWYGARAVPEYLPRYNIAPGTPVLVIRGPAGSRHCTPMHWGFIPSWASGMATVPWLNTARGETLSEKPMFREAFRARRCLIPASGFYQWKTRPGQRTKQAFYVSLKDGAPMSFGGLWEPAFSPDGAPFDTCTIITTCANALLGAIHHRMPLILERPDWDRWLSADDGQAPDNTRVRQMIRPYACDPMHVWSVASAIDQVSNEGPELLAPIP